MRPLKGPVNAVLSLTGEPEARGGPTTDDLIPADETQARADERSLCARIRNFPAENCDESQNPPKIGFPKTARPAHHVRLSNMQKQETKYDGSSRLAAQCVGFQCVQSYTEPEALLPWYAVACDARGSRDGASTVFVWRQRGTACWWGLGLLPAACCWLRSWCLLLAGGAWWELRALSSSLVARRPPCVRAACRLAATSRLPPDLRTLLP
jgi:hypothetical protein